MELAALSAVQVTGPETVILDRHLWLPIRNNAAQEIGSCDPCKSTIHLKNGNSSRSIGFLRADVTKPRRTGKSAPAGLRFWSHGVT
jgi:hypothetical protein